MDTFLTLDFGNTNPHLGLIQNQELLDVIPFSTDYLTRQGHPTLILSQVGPEHSFVRSYPGKVIDYAKLRTPDHFAGMPLHYSEGLGADRLLQGFFLYQKCIVDSGLQYIIHVDAGTFTTVNIITEKGFMGGPIFLGAQTFLDSYPRSEKLPKLNYRTFRPSTAVPETTQAAIQCAWEIFIQGTLNSWEKRFGPPALYIVSGGHVEAFASALKEKNTPWEARPHLIHQAMAYVHVNADKFFAQRTL